MTVSIAFAVIGGVILIGFCANLLFRITKIPSVLLLMAIGVVLGPLTGWVTSDALVTVAPFFGTLALLVILFEGGLELDIDSVLHQAPRAAILALLVFTFSFLSVAAFAFFFLNMAPLHSLMLGGILGAASPAICIPVISGLSVRKDIKAIIKLESALGDVLLIVTVLFVLDFQTTGNQGVAAIIPSVLISFGVAFAVSLAAGALWSRLIGWMGKEPLAYMLTLGFVFLLYFSVEELHGSAALAVLMFGFMLENMHVVADRLGERVRHLFGIDIRAEQFVLHEFMKNITEELSFLIRTFFFVYLGLLLDFSTLTPRIGISAAMVVILLIASRWLAVRIIRKRSGLASVELKFIRAMLPRGLATAVMAFLPAQMGVSGTDLFPIYAFITIVLTNILMTGGVLAAEKCLAREPVTGSSIPAVLREPEGAESARALSGGARKSSGEDEAGDSGPIAESLPEASTGPAGGGKESQQPEARSFTDWMSGLLEVRREERERWYFEAFKASSLGQPLFWVQIFLATALTALGLVLNQSAIIIGAALIVPIAWPVVAAGLALAVGDIYLLLKLLLKLVLVAAMVAALSAVISELLPFNAVTAEIAARTKPTILDFLVALFAGMSGSALLHSKRRMLRYFPGAILALTLLPPLAVIGFGFGSEFSGEIFRGASLLLIANLFAAILGSSLIYAAVGMPETAVFKAARVWKKEELSHPVMKLIFENPKVRSIIGRAGSVRSRLLVVVVFLLALVIPLQMAFNQLSLEFRARQAITEVAKMFDVAGRSAIINSMSDIREEEITVRIQVATNAFFTSADIEHFEERVSDRTGKPTRLNLVQSLSDIGEGAKISRILAQPAVPEIEYKPGIREMASGLREEMENSLRAAALPSSLEILGISAELGTNEVAPAFRIEYLAESPLSGDAVELLANLLERNMRLNQGSLHFNHMPSRHEFNLNSKMEIPENETKQLLEIQNMLGRYPRVRAHIRLSAKIGERGAEQVRAMLERLAPWLADSSRATVSVDSGLSRGFTVTLQPVSAPLSSSP